MKRRDALKVIGGAVAAMSVADKFGGYFSKYAYAEEKPAFHKEILSAPGGKRVVIIGGGFSGVSFANTLRELAPDAEIILLEKNPFFVSGPSHIDYSVGMKKLEDATRSYYYLREKGIKVIKTEVGGILPADNKVITSKGNITYNYLLISTGIRIADEEILQLSEHPAYNAHSWELEGTIELRRRVESFKGGKVVVSVPSAPFKCPPGPYETACLLDEFFKKKGVNAEVVVADANDKPQPPPLAQKWLTVFEKKGIKYMPNNKVVEIDGANNQLVTDKGEKIKYDFVTLIPPNKASTLIKESGLGDPFADVDPTTFKSKKFGNVFATGDCAKTPYTKSAYTAFYEGKNAAHYAAIGMGYSVKEPVPVHNICYPYISSAESLLIRVDWEKDGKMLKATADDPKTDYRDSRAAWESTLLKSLFGA
jgi:sulfide:quinone oxidoreductase